MKKMTLDYKEVTAYFILGVILGTAIHYMSQRAGIPVLIRLFFAMLAAESLYIEAPSGSHIPHIYFRIGLFYMQAPLNFFMED